MQFKFTLPWRLTLVPLDFDVASFQETLQEIVDYMDTFNCECRAYGRLIERGCHDIVVPCYGYLLLTDEQDATLKKMGYSVQRTDFHRGVPTRALVKPLIQGKPNFRPHMVPQMMRDLRKMNSIGITNRDIKANNYIDGKLFDFSIAWTMPHASLIRLAEADPNCPAVRKKQTQVARLDFSLFDGMVDDWNLTHGRLIWQRFFPNWKFTSSCLRDRPRHNPATLKGVNVFAYEWNKTRRRRLKRVRRAAIKAA